MKWLCTGHYRSDNSICTIKGSMCRTYGSIALMPSRTHTMDTYDIQDAPYNEQDALYDVNDALNDEQDALYNAQDDI